MLPDYPLVGKTCWYDCLQRCEIKQWLCFLQRFDNNVQKHQNKCKARSEILSRKGRVPSSIHPSQSQTTGSSTHKDESQFNKQVIDPNSLQYAPFAKVKSYLHLVATYKTRAERSLPSFPRVILVCLYLVTIFFSVTF